MSWTDPCGNCGEPRYACECGNWNNMNNKNKYKEIEGDLIALAKQGAFDVIAHGCNCFCAMGAGLAPKMADAFACDHYVKEGKSFVGDHNKLGTIDYGSFYTKEKEPCIAYSIDKTNEILEAKGYKKSYAVNCYTQYQPGRSLDYQALQLCLRKINHEFQGKHVGLPLIGGGIAGGDPAKIKEIIQAELSSCEVTLVLFKAN